MKRRSSSSAGYKKEPSEGDPKPHLRRSTREHAAPHTPGSPLGSPKSQRTRRRARGLPTSAQRGETAAAAATAEEDSLMATPAKHARDKESKSTGRGSSSKSARKQQQQKLGQQQPKLEAVASSIPEAASSAGGGPDLIATQNDGKTTTVKLIVDGQHFTHSRYRTSSPNPLPEGTNKKLSPTIVGQDGNLFYCVVCRGFGDVVCCDMCPHVYHPDCIPAESESRKSLDNDDDPWYCPECMSKKTPVKQPAKPAVKQDPPAGRLKTPVKQDPPAGRSEGSSRRTIRHRCQECQQTRNDLSLKPCKVCAVYIHYPPCRGSSTPPSENTSVLCSSCRAEAALTQEEQELQAKKKGRLDERERQTAGMTASGTKDPPEREEVKGRRRTRSMDGDDPVDNQAAEHEDYHPDEERSRPDVTPSAGQKRKSRDIESPDDMTKSERKRKKKKKKRKRDSDAHLPCDEASLEVTEASTSQQGVRAETPSFTPGGDETPLAMQGPPTQATPAFHFYLAEQRPKIEKLLSRKHRYFNRLPKGGERNALIAKEAAMQWVKLSSVDQKKYINMSMHDYESRIIAWKQEKQIRDMLVEPEGTTEPNQEAPSEEKAPDDHILTYEMHERLYLGTSVGSKPYKPEPDQSHNRVLLDLLRDMRFHPLPMLSVARPETEIMASPDASKVTTPHFDVHGPIATSVGDECLGCTRGWPHFCPVLRRRIPAIEHKSKLQPAASALISARVGLGLRPRLERTETEDEEEQNPGNSELLVWRETPDTSALRNVRFVPSSTLSDPSSRADDIVHFIEETLAMKIPVPPRPAPPVAGKQAETTTPKKSSLARGILPTRQKRTTSEGATGEAGENNGYENVNKCGRCRTIIMNESGCVQCRRAQLVINMSKKQPPVNTEQQRYQKPAREDLLKVQTAMLGRVITKEAIGENQAEADKKISNAILKERWAPCAVLPPGKTLAPSPSRRQLGTAENSTGDEGAKTDSSLQEESKQELETKTSGPLEKPTGPGQGELNTELRPRGRRTTAAPAAFESTDADRQIVARQHREEADKINKRTLSIACHGILLALLRRDPLLLFATPATAEHYATVVMKPIDFSKIRGNVLRNKYQSLGSFVADVRLLCENALIYNPPGSIYSKTAKDILDAVLVMQRRASKWISAIKNSHSSYWRKSPKKRRHDAGNGLEGASDMADASQEDPFKQLRQTWPEAVEMYENSDWVKNLLTADFSRTRENEAAFYGSLAVRRAAKAAEMCLAPYTDTGGVYAAVVKRSENDDEELRQRVDSKVVEIVNPVQLKDIASGREETIVRLLRQVQSRRLERRIGAKSGCARCDGMGLDHELKAVMNADARWGRSKKKGEAESESRVAASRLDLTTGLASAKTRARIARLSEKSGEERFDCVNDVCVSLRGSRIHGWGLFAEQPFKKGDVVAEYVGECVALPVADAREKLYSAMRIQDYQFRLDDSQIIDATMKGGLGRYINHNCNPNCTTRIILGKPPNQRLRRVLIFAQRDIAPREELTYDYQFPLELNLDTRIPCNCLSEMCRGFMNYDLPEKGANTGAIRTQKRGANMRDRIRRLGRPLKK